MNNDLAGAWKLLGVELKTGWKVIEPLGWNPASPHERDHYNGTGGHFSVAYVVERSKKKAFLKAIDLTAAIQAEDVMRELHNITSAHNFETHMLEICGGNGMDRVVVALESGQQSVGSNLQDQVPYLIFELADGDVRRRVQKINDEYRLSWWLRVMHHTCVGLSQLHSHGIAHQDLKPSNILAFGGRKDFRISDLGRSICIGTAGPHDELMFPGDWSYAPPEILYGQINPQWTERRLGCDAYLLGSMIFFFATGFGCTQKLISRLPSSHKPISLNGRWAAPYDAALPIIQNIFTELLAELQGCSLGKSAEEIIKVASELCNPDPQLRGHPLDRASRGNSFSLVRYISIFDRLSKKAELNLKSKSA